MPRVSNTIKQLGESLNEYSGLFFEHGCFKDDKDKLREFISIFNGIGDERIEGMCTYSTQTIIALVFLGILDEETTWSGIADFAQDRKEFLSNFIDLSKGVPTDDTLRRVFSVLDTQTLESVFVDFLQRCITTATKATKIEDEGARIISMDGKEEKGSGRKYNTDEKVKNAQIMHFYDVSTGICLKSVLIEEKTNEIPTAQKALKVLNIRNIIITSDAMNCQTATVDVIRDKKGHYVLGLKRNHNDFFKEIESKFEKKNTYSTKDYYVMEVEKNHNQVEKREFYRIPAKDCFGNEEWRDLKSIVMYKKTTINNFTGEENVEKRYYISDLGDTGLISEAIRKHWSVENQLHWHLDTNFLEDANSTMDKRALCNLSVLNKSVLTIMKLIQPLFGNRSIKRTQKGFRRDYEGNVIKLFEFLDKEGIKHIMKRKKDK